MKRRAQPWLGTLVDVTIADALTDEALRGPFRAAFVAIAEVHRLMSFHDQESDVSRINRAACDVPYEIHPHTFAVIECALSIAAASDGLFDIGCTPRLVEWGYLPAPTADAPDHIPVAPSLNLLAGNRDIAAFRNRFRVRQRRRRHARLRRRRVSSIDTQPGCPEPDGIAYLVARRSACHFRHLFFTQNDRGPKLQSPHQRQERERGHS